MAFGFYLGEFLPRSDLTNSSAVDAKPSCNIVLTIAPCDHPLYDGRVSRRQRYPACFCAHGLAPQTYRAVYTEKYS